MPDRELADLIGLPTTRPAWGRCAGRRCCCSLTTHRQPSGAAISLGGRPPGSGCRRSRRSAGRAGRRFRRRRRSIPRRSPSASVTLRMLRPTSSVVPTTSPEAGSMRLTLPLKLFVTQTKRLPATIPIGLSADRDRGQHRRPTTRSIRLTLSSSPLATQRNSMAEREALRTRSDGERLLLPIALHAADGAVVGVGDPDDATLGLHLVGVRADRDRLRRPAGDVAVDPDERVAARVGYPDRLPSTAIPSGPCPRGCS